MVWSGSSKYGSFLYYLYHCLTTNRHITQDRTTSHSWNENDEREFTALLEKELDKIHDFQKSKVILSLKFRGILFPYSSTRIDFRTIASNPWRRERCPTASDRGLYNQWPTRAWSCPLSHWPWISATWRIRSRWRFGRRRFRRWRWWTFRKWPGELWCTWRSVPWPGGRSGYSRCGCSWFGSLYEIEHYGIHEDIKGSSGSPISFIFCLKSIFLPETWRTCYLPYNTTNSNIYNYRKTLDYLSNHHSFKTTSSEGPSTSTTGTPWLSSFPSFTISFVPAATLCKVTLVLEGVRARSFVRRRNIGYGSYW